MSSELPHFIQENLIHVSDLHLSRKSRSKLALLNNLEFYEVDNKQIVNFIELQNTVLNKVKDKLIYMVPVLNGSATQTSDIFGSSIPLPGLQTSGLVIGKYIYQTKHDKKVYILIQCWDVMVVVRRDCRGFTLQAEYEEVRSFKVSKGKDYQVELEVRCNSSEQDIITNFQTNESTVTPLSNVDAYKKIQKVIKMKKSELLVHKKITKKQFVKLKSVDMLGCNILRTPRLDEMQILSKCGNAWVKLTANDDIVIGVPLVNNCSTHPTVLRNFRPVLHSSQDVDYTFSLYQLSKKFGEEDNVQSFFESQNQGDHNWSSWTQCAENSLRPSTVCVLVLRFKINEICGIDDRLIPLFGFFDIFTLRKTFHLKSFLSSLSLEGIFTDDLCRINFHEKHLHRDLLTVLATSYKTEGQLEFYSNRSLFEDYLCSNLSFIKVLPTPLDSELKEIDNKHEKVEVTVQRVLFYNTNSNSIWHGTLLDMTNISVSRSDVILYSKTQEKSILFFRVLGLELKTKCNIKEVHYDKRNLSTKLIEFEAALRDECASYLKMYLSYDKKEIEYAQMDVHLNTLKADILFKNLDS